MKVHHWLQSRKSYVECGVHEHQRARVEHLRQRAGIVLRIGRNFGVGLVTGRDHEPLELAVGHRRAVDPEAVHRHPVDRRFLRIMTCRTPCGMCRRESRSCRRSGYLPMADHPAGCRSAATSWRALRTALTDRRPKTPASGLDRCSTSSSQAQVAHPPRLPQWPQSQLQSRHQRRSRRPDASSNEPDEPSRLDGQRLDGQHLDARQLRHAPQSDLPRRRADRRPWSGARRLRAERRPR